MFNNLKLGFVFVGIRVRLAAPFLDGMTVFRVTSIAAEVNIYPYVYAGQMVLFRYIQCIIEAVAASVVSADEVCSRFDISPEILQTWTARYRKHGKGGLRVTRKVQL